MSKNYHSAIDWTEYDYPSVNRFEELNGTSFVWDLIGPTPKEYLVCDAFYAEPPFPLGYKVFGERANTEQRQTYKQFMKRCSDMFLMRPGVMISGLAGLKYVRNPAHVQKIRLWDNKIDVLALWYGLEPKKDYTNAEEIVDALCIDYDFDLIGDFCCGYGRTGEQVVRNGKRYVMSDIGPKCIGYISEHHKEWGK